ncbi:glutaredoxin [Candidatus Phycorickettsia trachydisci]|uniref:Glutaredoxin n=1 Tax=Candidatus Phycorickettsia trachydisci TaxID=2115978 RepID=A0A2P1P730_9RICK|nr:glutaredoxin 3 [Candidatus Phycorickettsia trachydisci]AVP87068.1 glutaredoxin [Candidatus Phycorickettsia trachydisci]
MEYVIDTSTHKVIIFTKESCSYCTKAKNLLDSKKVDYKEIDIEGKEDLKRALVLKTNGSTTVPQIFIKGEYIGGCDSLYALDAKGQLDEKLGLEEKLQ